MLNLITSSPLILIVNESIKNFIKIGAVLKKITES